MVFGLMIKKRAHLCLRIKQLMTSVIAGRFTGEVHATCCDSLMFRKVTVVSENEKPQVNERTWSVLNRNMPKGGLSGS